MRRVSRMKSVDGRLIYWILCAWLSIGVIVGGFVAAWAPGFTMEVVWPGISGVEPNGSLRFGGSSAMVFSLLGGVPALAISMYIVMRNHAITTSGILRSVWVGPVCMSVLYFLLPLVFGVSAVAGSLLLPPSPESVAPFFSSSAGSLRSAVLRFSRESD